MSSAGTGQKAVRKFPPPCWTRDEALVLIEAYRERWYALHRAFLKTPDWDAVAETVTSSCPDVTPPKTSAQCRHKMEKLRQRHRAEKLRASSFPGQRFFSTWFYYDAMEALENGSTSQPGNTQDPNPNPNPGHGIRVKPLAVQNLGTLPPMAITTKQRTKPNPNPNPNFNSGVSNRYYSYPNNNSNNVDGYEQRSLLEAPIEETLIPSAYRSRDSQNYMAETLIREGKSHKRSSVGSGIRSAAHEESGRPGLRPRKYSKAAVHDDDDEDDDDEGEMWMKVPRGGNVLRGKWRKESDAVPNVKKGKKRDGGIAEVVASIRLLGEGFMKVEKMKMDMAREIEEMRMQTEMRRNELMIESQKQIVEAFVQGLVESRKVQTAMGNM